MREKIKVHLLKDKTQTFEIDNLYLDDTIKMIKKKIINHIPEEQITYNEIYLFGSKKQEIDVFKIYNTITENETISISQDMLSQICLNLSLDKGNQKKLPENYEEFYDVLLSLNNQNRTFEVLTPIGIESRTKPDLNFNVPYLFPVNPFSLVLSYPKSELNYYDNKLFFEYVGETPKEIFLCPVLELEGHSKETPQLIFHNYYPRFFHDKITSFEQVRDTKKEQEIDTHLEENMNVLYDTKIHKPDIQEGIKEFTLYILPDSTVEIPSLEIIFKNIHATKTVPLVYYPTNINNTFRLYCDRISNNGKKIPLLEKNRIIRLWREIKKNKKITGINREYIKHSNKITLFVQSKYELFIDFKSNGVITVYREKLENSISLNDLNEILVSIVNPILESINTHLSETGFKVQIYDKIENNPHIKLENITYTFKTTVEDDMNIKETVECLTPLFLPLILHKKHAELIYKRVSRFEKTDIVLFYVLQQIEELQGDLRLQDKIVKGIVRNFKLSQEDALEKFREGFSQTNRQTEMPSGFSTLFHIDERKELTIEIQSISHMVYIQLLKTYIYAMLEISKNSSQLSLLCNLKKESEELEENVEEDSNYDIIEEEEFDLDDENDDDDDDFSPKQKIGFNLDDDDSSSDEDNSPKNKVKFDESDEDEDEYEDEDEEEEEEKYQGQLFTKKGKREKTSTILLNRLKKQAPKLFDYKTEDKYKPYSAKCQGDNLPIILTEREKNEIDKVDEKYEKSYGEYLELLYQYDKTSKFYFICPRYWSVVENRSISKNELKEGIQSKKYKIITRDNEKTQLGNVYEFTAHNKKIGNRIPDLKSIKNPDGYQLPCCYDAKKNEKKPKTVSEYISEKDPPIGAKRLGFLPQSLELFFQLKRNDFIDMKKIQPNVPILLRIGVEETEQSFLACFADIYNYLHNKNATVSQMIDIIVNAVDIDWFVKLHNGSLPSIFKPLKNDYKDLESRIERYQNSWFFSTIHLDNDVEERFFLDTIASYENFIAYLKDSSIVKDHTFLWDIITEKNEKLIPKKLNLIIFQVSNNDDNTEKINIVCPSTLHSTNFYDSKNDNILLLKKNNYYEPIYLYIEKREPKLSKELIKVISQTVLTDMKMKNVFYILQTIHTNIQEKCMPVPTSVIKKNISAQQLYRILREKNAYTVKYQVFHFNHKVIGFYVVGKCSTSTTKCDAEIFIPCSPSEPIDEIIHATYINNDSLLWKSYSHTVQELENVYNTHNKQIPCNPIRVVVESRYGKSKSIDIKRLAVGIITETNQFVQIAERPYNKEEHDLPVIEQSNTNTIDKILTTTLSKEDKQRVKTVNRILLEGQFYNSFRTVIRALLNDYSNRVIKKEILQRIQSSNESYKEKIKWLKPALESISKEEIDFSVYDNKTLDELSTCVEMKNGTCLRIDNNQLSIPKNNLVNGYDNSFYYYFRLADELLRYNRIRFYMLENTINMVDIEYKINKDELVIIENILFDQGNNTITYFDNLEPFHQNKYVHTITYENSQPQNINKIADKPFTPIDVDQIKPQSQHQHQQNDCFVEEREVIGNKQVSKWREFFEKENGKEIVFSNKTESCTFEVLLHILNEIHKKPHTVAELKTELLKAYEVDKKLLPSIANLWVLDKKISKPESKRFDMNTLKHMISQDTYYMTDIDIWLLCIVFKLPVVLFCATGLRFPTLEKKTWIMFYPYDENQEYYFIRTPTKDNVKHSKFPEYHLIVPTFKPKEFLSPTPEQTQGLTDYLSSLLLLNAN